jgi:release factor glutamine methyltransferase
MSANSLPPTLVIKDWLENASRQLSTVGISSTRLDAEIILAYTLHESRTYLHAHPEQIIDTQQCELANARLNLRIDRVPIAYIIGYKEFYGRRFSVTEATLIPRPESEAIIDLLKEILTSNSNSQIPIASLIDVGTGSGCLGITAKLEFPALDVTLIDVSKDALKVAELNAKKLSANVAILHSDLLQEYTLKPDIIIANLPYVDPTWDRSPETNHEPNLALFADNNGRSIIEKLIVQANNSLALDGYMIIEADPTQHDQLMEYAKKQSFTTINQQGYAIAFKHKPSN